MVFLGLPWTSLGFHVTARSHSWQTPLVPALPGGGNLFSLWVLCMNPKLQFPPLPSPGLLGGRPQKACFCLGPFSPPQSQGA